MPVVMFKLLVVSVEKTGVDDVSVSVVVGDASLQHSMNAGSHGLPKANDLKPQPWPIEPVKIPERSSR